MSTKEVIEDFFEEQFQNTSPFFLYKDKQLLKDGKYHKYAKEQINKASKICLLSCFSILLLSYYVTIWLIEYGAGPNWFDLILGLFGLAVLIVVSIYAAKEYYTIKSSMVLLLKLLDDTETT